MCLQVTFKTKKGFTLIELVIVVVLLATLASVALPRFLNITESAHSAHVSGTAGALGSAISIAHAKWLASGQPTALLDNINGINAREYGKVDIGFSINGWPIAATDGKRDITSEDIIQNGNAENSMICANIATNLLSASSVSFGVGNNCKKEYCAEYREPNCIYQYQKDKSTLRQVLYNIENGQVMKGPL